MNRTSWDWAARLVRAALMATAAAGLFQLASCGGGGEDPAAPNPPPSNAQPLRTFGAPLVTPTLDVPRARAAYIGARGGRVQVELADGTRATLEVPPGALSEQRLITLTPVTQLNGLPLQGGLVAAVDMQPAGLAFAMPALLRIELPDDAAPLTVPFGWTGAEKRFAVVPGVPEPGRREFRIAIEHFSGYGLGIAGPSQLDALAGELIDLGNEEQRTWSVLRNAAFGTDCDGRGCTEADFDGWVQDWWGLITKPRLDEGSAGPVAALVGHKAMRFFETVRLLYSGNEPHNAHADLQTAGRALDIANLKRQHDAYTRPQCSGTVTDWKDWIRIPDELRARIVAHYPEALDDFPALASEEWASLGGVPGGSSCAQLKAEFVDPPSALGDDEFRIPLRLRTRIVHPGGELPVSARVFLGYSDGAAGPAEFHTDASGEGAFDVDRDLTWPGVSVTAFAIEESVQRNSVTSSFAVANIGQSALTISSPGQQLVVPAGTEDRVWIRFAVDGVPIEGVEVDLTFEGPGRIDLDEEVTDSRGYVFGTYTAPPYPVPRNYVAIVRAQATHAGQTYQARADIQPQWADLTLELHDGNAWVPATNRSVAVQGDGPFALRTSVSVSGEKRRDPPLPAPLGSLVGLITAEDTLAQAGNCCADLALSYLDSEGRGAEVDWRANGSVGRSQKIEAVYPNLAQGAVGASVTLDRLVAGVQVDFPAFLPAGVERPVTVTVLDNLGRPVPGAVVSMVATGGSASGGTTGDDGVVRGTARLDSGATELVVDLRVTAPGGGVIDTRVLVATPAPPVRVSILHPSHPSPSGQLFISRRGRFFLGTGGVPLTLSSDCASVTLTSLGSGNELQYLRLTGSVTEVVPAGCSISLAFPIVVVGGRDVVADVRGVSVWEMRPDGNHQLLRDYRTGGPVTLKQPPFYYLVSRSQTVAEPEPFDIELVFSALP